MPPAATAATVTCQSSSADHCYTSLLALVVVSKSSLDEQKVNLGLVLKNSEQELPPQYTE